MRAPSLALVVLLALGFPGAAAAQAARAPYLQQGTPDSMLVVWRSVASTGSTVCWGAAPDALTQTATGPAGTGHVVGITGLEPSSRYFYAVSASGACPVAGDPADFFRTAPPIGARTPFSMWVVGDSGTGGARQAAVFDAMRGEVSEDPELFLHVGDMAYTTGTTAEFDSNFFAVYEDLLRHSVVWPAMGNHEGATSNSSRQSGPYYEAYVLPTDGAAGGIASGTEAYYSVDYGNLHLVVLESHETSRAVDGPMLTWLSDDLAATDQEWIVAIWHHPPYTDGSHDSDTENQLIQMRENALPILEAAGVDVVIGGHSHIYERSYLLHGAYDTPTTAGAHIVDSGDGRLDGDGAYQARGDGALYVVAGHGGAGVRGAGAHPVMFFSEVENGSCLIDVAAGSLTLRNVRWDGVESDHVTLLKGDGIFLVSPVGGETYLAGSVVDVVWTSTNTSGEVRLEYSLDDGRTWTEIVGRTADDGHHAWPTPRRVSTEVRVRVSDVADAGVFAESPAPFALAAEAEREAVASGSVWEYHDDGSEPPSTWRTQVGDWASGPAQLGYGDGDEATRIDDSLPHHASHYFRRSVTVEGAVTSARLRVLYDDGFAVFVNGAEVLREGVDLGLEHDVFASSQSTDNAVLEADIDTSPFFEGENIIAVVVKQVSASSSDVSFDLSLTLGVQATLDADPPDAGVAPPSDGGSVAPADDAGATSEVDAGSEPPVEDKGCGCRSVGGSSRGGAGFGLLLVGLAWRRARRA